MEEEYFKIIIEKKLNGTATPEEEKFLELFEQTMLQKNNATVFLNDAHRAKVHKEISSKFSFISKSKPKIQRRYTILNMAASILIIVALGFSYVYFDNDSKITFENTSNFPQKYKLSDGSLITLNQNSKLIQDNKFNTRNRFVELEGEAFFEIQKNKSLPFIIKTKTIFTKVVGTKFNINSSKDYINVSVNEGHVKVFDNKDTLDATPNKQITYNIKNKTLVENKIQADIYNLWTKDEFELDNITINDLSRLFESIYNYKIDFKNEKVKNKRISITFDRKDKIDTVLAKINLINEFKLTKKQNNMIEAY